MTPVSVYDPWLLPNFPIFIHLLSMCWVSSGGKPLYYILTRNLGILWSQGFGKLGWEENTHTDQRGPSSWQL